MDSLENDRDLVESVLRGCADFYSAKDVRTVIVFDRVRDQYLILEEGWDGYKRVHFVFVHVELAEGKFWIQKDGTQDGIALDLIIAGISQDRLVLAFQHPSLRRSGDFVAA